MDVGRPGMGPMVSVSVEEVSVEVRVVCIVARSNACKRFAR